MDDSAYRMSRGIVRLTGRVFAPSGKLDQEFENKFDAHGKLLGGRAVHHDGTVVEY
jgi:hypothetical protein